MRKRIPTRRSCETVDVWYRGERFHVSFTQWNDGRIAEFFVHGPKIGSDLDSLICTAASAISIALQCGASLGDISHAALRFEDGTPSDFLGAILDILRKEEHVGRSEL